MHPTQRPEVPELDELLVTVVVDNATDTLSSIAEGIPQQPEAAHLFEGPSVGTYDGHPMVAVFEQLCVACHGFSALVTGRRGHDTTTAQVDVGPSADVSQPNAARLDIEQAEITVLFVPHWHGDHTGGIPSKTATIGWPSYVPTEGPSNRCAASGCWGMPSAIDEQGVGRVVDHDGDQQLVQLRYLRALRRVHGSIVRLGDLGRKERPSLKGPRQSVATSAAGVVAVGDLERLVEDRQPLALPPARWRCTAAPRGCG